MITLACRRKVRSKPPAAAAGPPKITRAIIAASSVIVQSVGTLFATARSLGGQHADTLPAPSPCPVACLIAHASAATGGADSCTCASLLCHGVAQALVDGERQAAIVCALGDVSAHRHALHRRTPLLGAHVLVKDGWRCVWQQTGRGAAAAGQQGAGVKRGMCVPHTACAQASVHAHTHLWGWRA